MEEDDDLEEEDDDEEEEDEENEYGEEEEEEEEIQSHAPAPNGRLTGQSQPVTVAAPPRQTLTLALPIQNPRTTTGVSHVREDCWSEGATSTLIDAWGERYLELSRGNLKQKHWQEVADVVSSRDDYTKPPKTDVQCKNRIDTLKKKYKTEKAKITSGSGPSKWPFFHRLERLIGPSHKPNSSAALPAPAPAPATKIPLRIPEHRNFHHPIQPQRQPSNSGGDAPDSSDSFPPVTVKKRRTERDPNPNPSPSPKPIGRGGNSVRELTRAIMRIGEVYERVERSKLQQVIELEKQRMGFVKELELQRMQFFMKTQLELAQMEPGRVGNSNNSNNTG